VCSPLSGRIVGNRGPRLPLLLAGALLTAGGLLLVPMSASESYPRLIGSFVVFAAGFGLVNVPITNTAVSGMPREQAGVAAAVASTSRQMGATLGVAVVGTVLTNGINGPLGTGFVTASHPAWWVVTGCGLASLCSAPSRPAVARSPARLAPHNSSRTSPRSWRPATSARCCAP
jgi:predicted MFS family arabinose efflux permease